MHNPRVNEGFVGCGLYANLYYFYMKESGEYVAEKVLDVPAKKVEGWAGGAELNGLMGDIVLSLDDKFLYFNNWLQGDVRQYDITNPRKPLLKGQVFLGGISVADSGIKVTEDKELTVSGWPPVSLCAIFVSFEFCRNNRSRAL